MKHKTVVQILLLKQLLLIVIVGFILVSCTTNEKLILVLDGQATSVIILPENSDSLQKLAVYDFVNTVKIATGAEIPVISENEASEISTENLRIVLGPSKLTSDLGFPGDDLNNEEFRIHSKQNHLIVLAKDIIQENPPDNSWGEPETLNTHVTQWAFGYILDHYMGVRWLWPGELGTHIPKLNELVLPGMDISMQQALVQRCFLMVESNQENILWLNYHQFAGERKPYRFSHSFRKECNNGDWYNEFKDIHPEYLAKNPDGMPGLAYGAKTHFKLCISNPDVTNEIIRRWEKAGMPDFWDITSNDGGGYCTCDNCRALDKEYGDISYTKEEIWYRPDYVFLTDRLVWFWNQLILKMREKNPDVHVGVYLYSAYRNPPKKLKLEKGIVGHLVHGFDFSYWEAWQEAGIEEIGLRPNWLYMGASAPHLPLNKVGNYVEQARDHGMVMIQMDNLNEFWATQGPYYYLLGRLVARPDLNTADIISEYCAVFENAAPEIRNYLDYWEEYSKKIAFNIPAGGKLSQDPDGLYETLSREHFGEVMHPLRGHWKIMPYLYTEEVLQAAYDILERAERLASEEITRQRKDFLRDGLVMVKKASSFMSAEDKESKAALEALIRFGDDMREKHGYWNSKDIYFLKYWGIIREGDRYRGI